MLTLVAWMLLKLRAVTQRWIFSRYAHIICVNTWLVSSTNTQHVLRICNLDLRWYFGVVGGCHLHIFLENRTNNARLLLSDGKQKFSWFNYWQPPKTSIWINMFSDKSLYFKQKQQIFDCMGAIAELSWLRLNEFWNHIQAIFNVVFSG